MARIVISYRRDDASAHAGRIYDRLRTEFGPDQVFMDIDAIEPGVDFVEAIEEAIGTADVLIAVIGRRWVSVTGEDGEPRIKNPTDFVRLELATALQRNIRVIPVLVDGATMPTSDDLPEDLAGLVRRNAIDISHARFHADAQRLAGAVRKILELEGEGADASEFHPEAPTARAPDPHPELAARLSTREPSTWKRRVLIAGASLLGVIALIAGYLAYDFLTLPPQPSTFARLAWSPDGQRIAFAGLSALRKDNLYVVATDGSGWEKLENDAVQPVTWSPDGAWITFERSLRYIARSQWGDEDRVLPGDAMYDGSLAWSSDGHKAAYWTQQIGDQFINLRIMNFDDRGLHNALRTRAPGLGRDHGIAWSPGDSLIAVVVSQEGRDLLSVVNAQTGETRSVFDGGQMMIMYPSWSNDGEWIVFSSGTTTNALGGDAIYRIRPDGSGLVRLTADDVAASGSQISPDGTAIAATITTSALEGQRLYLMNLDGSGHPRPVSPDTLSVYPESVSWSPDGSRLAFVTYVRTPRLFGRVRSAVAIVNRDGTGFKVLGW